MREGAMAGKDVWFKYSIVAGRFSGWPVNWKGWLVLLLMVGGPVLALNLAIPWLKPFGSVGMVVALLLTFAVVLPTTIAVVRAKGERVR
jgi:hypothetical protein